jgi:histone H3/H4
MSLENLVTTTTLPPPVTTTTANEELPQDLTEDTTTPEVAATSDAIKIEEAEVPPTSSGKKMRKSKKPKRAVKKPYDGEKRKKHRYRPGTVALREIKRQQKSVDNILPAAAFTHVVREICEEMAPNMRWRREALKALQAGAEEHVIRRFSKAQIAALHAKRITVEVSDMQIVEALVDA